ncbi:hypothetical protein [Micromonospora inyonensis]|uniref:Uncharacterized protein n=1 Tax=Micromonospora inyonensis TaxID=47866 RepID=A0A1C6SRX8_9ACTN|nr:hypothetical protein [Micromonospora inyonensis]SCL32227.1 hypothetical protein GA0074694_6201 [Micromonospora inyonensis]
MNEPFTPSHQAPADIDPALLDFDDANADVIACLAAMHRGDHRGAAAVLASTNVARLAYPLLHLVAALGPAAVGAEAWAEALTAWQPGQSLGEGLAR